MYVLTYLHIYYMASGMSIGQVTLQALGRALGCLVFVIIGRIGHLQVFKLNLGKYIHSFNKYVLICVCEYMC